VGVTDYISLCTSLHTLIITNVPQMHMGVRDKARRFINLVDQVGVCVARVESRCLRARHSLSCARLVATHSTDLQPSRQVRTVHLGTAGSAVLWHRGLGGFLRNGAQCR